MKDSTWTKPSTFDMDLASYGREQLEAGLRLVLGDSRVTHFKVEKTLSNEEMTLFWSEGPDCSPMAFPSAADVVVEIVWGWLQQANYGPAPDTDGSSAKGFKLHTRQARGWGYAVVTVETDWAIFGK